MEQELREKIQDWVDSRLGTSNTFNTQLLIDFSDWLVEEAGYVSPEEVEIKVEKAEMSGWDKAIVFYQVGGK